MIVKGLASLAAVAAFMVPAGASAEGPSNADYAATAISAGSLQQAEQALQPVSYADASDPARLINIAVVYTRTDRTAAARAALMRVQALPAEQLDLANGPSYSSHVVAKAMLAKLDGY